MIPTVAVILSGGSGTRLWPLSRKSFPKQFLNLFGEGTMFQQTIDRVKDITDLHEIMIISNDEHRFIVAEQLRLSQVKGRILLEPSGKNTAPAIALAALDAIKRHGDAYLVVVSSDHVIESSDVFTCAVESAIALSEKSMLVTFGIVPHSPETGYGYIKASDMVGNGYRVDHFIEKPQHDIAQKMIDEGNHYWNSGMFVFKASDILLELKSFRPDIVEACESAIESESNDLDFIRFDSQKFDQIPSESIDYAVMEYSKNVAVIPFSGMWSDIGSWDALWSISEKDKDGNMMIGDVIALNTKNSYLRSNSKSLAVAGVEEIIVVVTDDAVLVSNKTHTQQVKDLVNQLKLTNRDIVEKHQEVHRPWGFYTTLDKAERFQVKRIVVKPGEKLSFQMHYHRAEHWIIVQGTANVLLGEESYIVSENQSIHIPLGVKHSLQNPGKISLEVIEVQSGTYLEEDDIVRFQDEYGRT